MGFRGSRVQIPPSRSVEVSARPLGYRGLALSFRGRISGRSILAPIVHGRGGRLERRAIPPMILSHPNDHDNRSFSSSSALAASAAAWERLAGPESTPESR